MQLHTSTTPRPPTTPNSPKSHRMSRMPSCCLSARLPVTLYLFSVSHTLSICISLSPCLSLSLSLYVSSAVLLSLYPHFVIDLTLLFTSAIWRGLTEATTTTYQNSPHTLRSCIPLRRQEINHTHTYSLTLVQFACLLASVARQFYV